MKKNSPLLLIIIVLLASIGYFATDIYLPSLPAISDEWGIGNTAVQMSISIYFMSFCITPLVFGPFSDSVGRKPVIIGGLTLGGLATLACIFAPNIHWLIAGRLVQGIGMGAVVTCARSMIPDNYAGKEMARASSIMTTTMPIILAMAPATGGILEELYNWRLSFIFLLACVIILLLTFALKIPESVKQKQEFKIPLKTYLSLFKNRRFVAYALIPSNTMFGISAYITVAPFIFQDMLGVSAAEFGFLSLFVGASVVACGLINTAMIGKRSEDYFIRISTVLQISGGCVLLLLHFMHWVNPITFLMATMLYFGGLSLAFPNAFTSAFNCLKSDFGAAGALISSVQIFVGFLASSLFSVLPEDNVYYLALAFVGVGIAGNLCLAFKDKAPGLVTES